MTCSICYADRLFQWYMDFLRGRNSTDVRSRPGQTHVVFFHYTNSYTIGHECDRHFVLHTFCIRRYNKLALTFSAVENCTTEASMNLNVIMRDTPSYCKTKFLHYIIQSVLEITKLWEINGFFIVAMFKFYCQLFIFQRNSLNYA